MIPEKIEDYFDYKRPILNDDNLDFTDFFKNDPSLFKLTEDEKTNDDTLSASDERTTPTPPALEQPRAATPFLSLPYQMHQYNPLYMALQERLNIQYYAAAAALQQNLAPSLPPNFDPSFLYRPMSVPLVQRGPAPYYPPQTPSPSKRNHSPRIIEPGIPKAGRPSHKKVQQKLLQVQNQTPSPPNNDCYDDGSTMTPPTSDEELNDFEWLEILNLKFQLTFDMEKVQELIRLEPNVLSKFDDVFKLGIPPQLVQFQKLIKLNYQLDLEGIPKVIIEYFLNYILLKLLPDIKMAYQHGHRNLDFNNVSQRFRLPNGFFLFRQKNSEIVKRELEGEGQSKIIVAAKLFSRIMGMKWKDLSQEEKDVYNRIANTGSLIRKCIYYSKLSIIAESVTGNTH